MMDHDHGDEDPSALLELYWFPVTRPTDSGQHPHARAAGYPFGCHSREEALDSVPTERTMGTMRTTILLLAASLALVACVTSEEVPPKAPEVAVVAVGAPHPELERYEAAVRAWAPVGFRVWNGDDSTPVCGRRWYEEPRDLDCVISITLNRRPDVTEEQGALGYAIRELRSITIDDGLTGLTMQGVVAHEVGHVILDTGEHRRGGIMGEADWVMGENDYQLACDSVGLCADGYEPREPTTMEPPR